MTIVLQWNSLLQLALLLLLLLVCGPAICYALHIFVVHRRYRRVPGPQRYSFISGNVSQFIAAAKQGKTREELILDWHQQYGYVFVIFVFHKAFVSCIDPELVKLVLLQHPRSYPRSRYYADVGFLFGERVFGSGIITETNHDKWARQRAVFNAAFHRKFLCGQVTDFNRFGDELVKVLRPLANNGKCFDISDYFHRVTQDALSQVAFGVCVDSLKGNSDLHEAVRGLFVGFEAAMKSVLPAWSPFVRRERQQLRKSVRLVKSAAAEVIKSRLEQLQRQEEVPDDILSIMLRAHVGDSGFSMDLILDNMISFYTGGQETSAVTLSFMFMELGRHPDVLAKVCKEVDDQIGNRDFITYEDVQALSYTTMVIKETLRLYTVIPGTFRDLSQPLMYGTFCLPAEATLRFSSFVSGRHPDFFNNPYTFDPDRFDSKQQDRVLPTTYYPFSLGPRSCIGQNFAMVEMKIFIAKMLQRYKYQLDKSQSFSLRQTATMQPAHGVWVSLSER